MYFVKTRKTVDEKETVNDSPEVSRTGRDRPYQRSVSDSARLLLQALPQHKTQTTTNAVFLNDGRRRSYSEKIPGSTDQFLEDLPDGVCFRQKKDLNLTNIQQQSPAASQSSDKSNVQTDNKSTTPLLGNLKTVRRPAQYVGTFSVCGSDKSAREKQMEQQLEHMRSSDSMKPVDLLISAEGVKVMNTPDQTLFMEHSLKRIWYATCDPEYRQFSFLAREPKTSAETQYCHAFVTDTSDQAEELISIIGEAFKSTTTAPVDGGDGKKQPTFHEIIEQQVQQQQAEFRKIEKESQTALQQKLKEIATPTPFSEKVITRMEQRRQSEDLTLTVGQDKVWAKQLMERKKRGDSHSRSPDRNGNTRHNDVTSSGIASPQSSPFKRNSVPSQTTSPTPVPSSSSPHPLSAQAIKESIESQNSSSKFKGSPITAMKNEIDRRLSLAPEADPLPPDPRLEQRQHMMANRPLPTPPSSKSSPSPARGSSKQRLRQQHSLDDQHLPRSMSSHTPLQTTSPLNSTRPHVILRDSPRRKQNRPMSEIAISSVGTAYFQQQRQSLLNSFQASFYAAQEGALPDDGMYIYGSSQTPETNGQVKNSPNDTSTAPKRGWDKKIGEDGVISSQKNLTTQGVSGPDSSQDVPVPRYQNGSPFASDLVGEEGPYSHGFDSLMCLDRSHIHDDALRQAPWYQAGLPREIALEILGQETVGSFIVRDSSTHPGCYALSVRVPKFENPSGISHYLILRTHRGVKLKGLEKEWSTLTGLVTHHTVMRELLPCTLKLPKVKGEKVTTDEEEEEKGDHYNQLSKTSEMLNMMNI